jgi:predicted PurR-regulated permease PerM
MKVLKPSDFFCGVSWQRLKRLFHKMPVRTVLAVVLTYSIALVMFLLYYVTLIPWLVNELVNNYTEWNL